MKKTEWEKIKEQSAQELQTLCLKLQREIVDFKMQLSLGKIKNTHTAHKKRQEIARIKTILKERELMEELKPAGNHR
ncbi:50S ribosomal protein L29 [Candidatus Beckwithbacteria bacterium RBG_13_42_9]|uniref:Large ribosomal subunit protein uL29 n=1 Tax=Candidatus Beckwithbacteria bacterium RBG_13_42_9 TaxID=1797457 RepID=A0A1F5E944_9BACT|nr:MAG: 50S ribosomal protein L29 [Candidatus Beckwithbacteria bacterium RBG_13_42_9]